MMQETTPLLYSKSNIFRLTRNVRRWTLSHIRLRRFNTRDVYPEQKLDNELAMVVRAGNTVYLRGQTALSLDGEIVGIGDPAAQTENAMACVKTLLEEAGAKLEDIVKTVIYITDRSYREPVYRVVEAMGQRRLSGFNGHCRPSLGATEYLMEIDILSRGAEHTR